MIFRRATLVFLTLSPLLSVLVDAANSSGVRGGAGLTSGDDSSRELDELMGVEDAPTSFEDGEGMRLEDQEPLFWKGENEATDYPTCPLQRLLLEGGLSGDEHLMQQGLEDSRRKLGGPVHCVVTHHGIDYFEIEIAIHPSGSRGHCELADTVMLGNDINRILWDYGLGPSGRDDRAIFVAGVCNEPE